MQPHSTTLPPTQHTGSIRIPLSNRFWSKVEKGPGCWLWTGAKFRGEGIISAGRPSKRILAAHRVSYELANGPIPDGVRIFHKCANSLCVRPAHLYLKGDNVPPERFWPKVNKTDNCWEWIGALTGNGKWKYGVLTVAGQKLLATHLSYEMAYGPIPKGLWVLHRCDNPKCVRPDHLFLGTPADNMHDMWYKGREKIVVGEERGCAKLTEQDVRCIRQSFTDGATRAALGRQYGVSSTTIFHIVHRNKWKHVD